MPQKPKKPDSRVERPKRREKKEKRTKFDEKIENLQKFFRRAIFLSIVAHAPIWGGALIGQKPIQWGKIGIVNYGEGNLPGWVKDTEKTIEKEWDVTPEEAKEIVEHVDPEALEGFKKAQKAIEMRKAERAKNIDPERVKRHKEEIRRKLEAGEKILYRDFVFEVEEIAEGVDPQVVENGRKIFLEEMKTLEAMKPPKPTREFLREMVSLSESKEKGDAYEPTRTSVAEYCDRKGKGLRGNCQARGKYMAMALEYLYPDRWEDVQQQKTGNHIRTLFTIDKKTYQMEPGVPELTQQDRKGTILFHPDRSIEMYAGKKVDPVPVEGGPVKEKKKKDGLPVITDNTAFPTPQADGKLRDQDQDMSFLYQKKFTPPEVRNLRLEPIPVQPQKPPEPGVLDLAEPFIVKDKKGNITEVLPWKPKDYTDQEITDRVSGKYFFGNARQYGKKGAEGPILNPSVKTIQKINRLAVDEIHYEDNGIMSQDALEEIFKTPVKRIKFHLKHPTLTMALGHALKHSRSAGEYKGELMLEINRDPKNRLGVTGDEQGLPPDQFKILMSGDGGLSLRYNLRKNFDEEETKMIARSSRPYVLLQGSQCTLNSEVLKHMKDAKITTLVLHGNAYFPLVIESPDLLLNEKIAPVIEFFDENDEHHQFSQEGIKNAYLLREILNALGKKSGRLDAMIEKLEKVMKEKFRWDDDALEKLKAAAVEHFEDKGIESGPMGSMGACQIPETNEEAKRMGVQSKQLVSPQGVQYTEHWSGKLIVPDGVQEREGRTTVKLLDGASFEVEWGTYKTVRLYLKKTGGGREGVGSFVNGEWVNDAFTGTGGSELRYNVQPDGYGRIQYPNEKYIEFLLPERPKSMKPLVEKNKQGITLVRPMADGPVFEVTRDFAGNVHIREEDEKDPNKELILQSGASGAIMVKGVTIMFTNGPLLKVNKGAVSSGGNIGDFYVDVEKGEEVSPPKIPGGPSQR